MKVLRQGSDRGTVVFEEGESGISAGVDWMRSCVKFDSWVRSGEACDPGWAPSGVNQLVEKYE